MHSFSAGAGGSGVLESGVLSTVECTEAAREAGLLAPRRADGETQRAAQPCGARRKGMRRCAYEKGYLISLFSKRLPARKERPPRPGITDDSCSTSGRGIRFCESGRSTNSTNAMSALSPMRLYVLSTRV